MGVPTVTAARILKGQLNGQSGEETQLEMDKFPFVSLAKVWLILTSYSMAQCIDLAITTNGFLTRPVTVNKVTQCVMLYWLCIMLQIWWKDSLATSLTIFYIFLATNEFHEKTKTNNKLILWGSVVFPSTYFSLKHRIKFDGNSTFLKTFLNFFKRVLFCLFTIKS